MIVLGTPGFSAGAVLASLWPLGELFDDLDSMEQGVIQSSEHSLLKVNMLELSRLMASNIQFLY